MFKLLHGDCLELLKDIADGSVDLTVTSPPYDNLRSYNGNNNQWSADVWQKVIAELYRVTKDGGVVVWVAGDATIKGSETGTSFKQALHAMDCGFNLHDTMIYAKSNCYAHDPRNKRYKQAFEYMFVWSKGKPNTYNEIKDKPNKHAGKTISGTKGRNADGVKRKLKTQVIAPFQARFNMWEYTTGASVSKYKEAFKHPAIFPEQLAHDHIVSWSNEGDTVLDCFMGSGTTGAMCAKTNRGFIGIELDRDYYDIAVNRINEAKEAVNGDISQE